MAKLLKFINVLSIFGKIIFYENKLQKNLKINFLLITQLENEQLLKGNVEADDVFASTTEVEFPRILFII